MSYDVFLAFCLDVEENSETMQLLKTVQQGLTRNRFKAKDVLKLFQGSKTFKNGYVRVTEFEKALKKAVTKIKPDDLAALVKRWDVDGEGTVDIKNFVNWTQVCCGDTAETQ